ncbi:MAG TPA: biopolymer transporter ExbD [Alphaproteobacteria bacterium]|nr:biopolymer transporter ExbD [Alphaproteobacteria bacterium]
MKKTSRSHHSSLSELNITPLLDLVFVLLVIFIITTPQMMNNLEMSLPSPNPPRTKDKPKINNIVVDASGQTFLNNELVTMPLLRQRLQDIKDQDPDPNVVVNGADAVDYQHIINVLDILQQLSITKVGLATVE